MIRTRFKSIEQYMLGKMQGVDYAHDASHVYRVLDNALILSEVYEADVEVLLPAVLLHDIGRLAEFHDAKADHALVGAHMAYEFLISIGYEEPQAAVIKKCIASHRFSEGDMPETMEEKILYDADKLDLTGSMAIARAILAGAAYHEPLYVQLPDGRVSDGIKNGEISFMSFYNKRLKIVGDRLFTEKAREMASDRLKLVEDFYNAIIEEIAEPRESTLETLAKILN